VAIDGDNIHVVWQEDRDGNIEIYYKRYYRQTPNQKPTADTLDFSANYVYMGDSITLYANASDDFDNEYDLTPTFEYKFSSDEIWQNTNISHIIWDSKGLYWKATFSPSNETRIGMYDFRVKFTDSDSEESDWINGSEQIDVRVRPIAVLSTSTTNIIIGESITFNASMSIGQELLFYFDFGDGTTVDWGYDAVKTHKYSKEGIYSAQVKVKDVYSKESLSEGIEIAVSSSKSDEDSGTSGFEIFLVICSIALVLLWKRKKMQ
jgi:PKD repeat protein